MCKIFIKNLQHNETFAGEMTKYIEKTISEIASIISRSCKIIKIKDKFQTYEISQDCFHDAPERWLK